MTVWLKQIEGFAPLRDQYVNDGSISFEDMRDGIAAILRRELAPRLDLDREPNWSLVDILSEWEDQPTNDGLEEVLEDLYDWCDVHHVWIDPNK